LRIGDLTEAVVLTAMIRTGRRLCQYRPEPGDSRVHTRQENREGRIGFVNSGVSPSLLFFSELRAAVARSQELEQERHGIRRNRIFSWPPVLVWPLVDNSQAPQ